MKRIWAIFRRDLSSSFREFILLYMMVAPIMLALIIRFFVPSANSAALQFAVDGKIGTDAIERLEQYGSVEIYGDRAELEKRVRGADDIAGITKDASGNYQIILQGNEAHDTKAIPQMIIRDMISSQNIGVDFSVRDLGYTRSPVARIGAASLILTVLIVAGAVIGFNMIEEKDGQTLSALNVTPMRRFEFIIGKSIIGMLLPLVMVYLILWILDIWYINKGMIFVMTLVSSSITVITGFLIGAMSSNQIAGIANMKILLLPLGASVIGALMLPPDKQVFVYWIPTYWSFLGFDGIMKNSVTWGQIGVYAAWILGLILIMFLLLRGRMKKGFV